MLTVDEIMTSDVLTLQADEPIFKGLALMAEHNIRHVPLVNKLHLLKGIVSHRDILRANLSSLSNEELKSRADIETIPIESIMSKHVCAASPKDSLLSVGRILQREKFGCVPIVDDGILVGIVTDTDYVSVAITLIEAMEDFEDAVEDGDIEAPEEEDILLAESLDSL